ncbi:MAG TPA: cytochrome P450 [Burkholderiales bacterium]|jgi:cytochrome P450|nr:cytochrome P450 [Burkholderiales bacterium]
MTLDYKPNDAATLADPFPLYARLRDEDPAHWSPRLKAWVLTRYEDVKRVCLDSSMSSDRLRPFFATLPPTEAAKVAELVRYLTLWMVFRDPPEHTRLRRLAARVFNVRSINALRPNIESLTAWLLDSLADKKEFDFIADFAMPLPALVIMDMLGAPREELPRLKRLSDEMALFIGSARDAPEKYQRAGAATREMADLFRELITARRASPQRDLLSELVALDDAGDRLSEDELVATCILLLFAGHETTTHHLANGLLALLRFPDELMKLRANRALAPAAVEELLRYDGPIGAQVRIVQEAHTLHGRQLNPGDRVFLLMNAANRDPRAYDEPDRVDLTRNGVPHLTFGFGMHICLGFPLARLEGQVALPAVLARWRRLELASQRLEWMDSMVLRGMKAMPVRAMA